MPRIERLQHEHGRVAPLAATGARRQRRLQSSWARRPSKRRARLWSIKTGRMQESTRRGRRHLARARAGAARAAKTTSSKLGSRWSRFAWCTTNWNGCVHRSTGSASTVQPILEIKCPMNVRDQTVPLNREAYIPPQYYAQLQAPAGGLCVHGGGPLLVVRWQRGKPGPGKPRPRIPEKARGCRSQVLAAGQRGQRVARAGGKGTRSKHRPEMA